MFPFLMFKPSVDVEFLTDNFPYWDDYKNGLQFGECYNMINFEVN